MSWPVGEVGAKVWFLGQLMGLGWEAVGAGKCSCTLLCLTFHGQVTSVPVPLFVRRGRALSAEATQRALVSGRAICGPSVEGAIRRWGRRAELRLGICRCLLSPGLAGWASLPWTLDSSLQHSYIAGGPRESEGE